MEEEFNKGKCCDCDDECRSHAAYLSQQNAGNYLDLSYATIHRWVLKGTIPFYTLPPGGDGNHKPIIRLSRKELDEFVTRTRVAVN